MMKAIQPCLLLIAVTLIAGCSSIPPASVEPQTSQLPILQPASNSIVKSLHDQHEAWKGVKYRYGGLSKSGVDCSGFVFLTFKEQFGAVLPRSTRRQAETGLPVTLAQLRPGDLVLFKTGFKDRHIGIYAGEQRFLHASTSRGVKFSRLDNPYWKENFWQARRVF
ncbi:NlpC/P60 family protein [Alkalimarinus coralli]|uniref:NlpC/P60 family protein n=1 Tax=Alkalimarinus coralli TaxID=2935863 RepID=UPI00202AED92|nr:NlpC/P60 family protein [Alkalimarinus coralli]